MFDRPAVSPDTESPQGTGQILGIWRLGARLTRGAGTDLFLAQPADSQGNPRYDYVLKTVAGVVPSSQAESPNPNAVREAQRQIGQAIQASGITHPNLIAILDASGSPHAPYVVMPRLAAVSMDERTRQIPHFAVPVALWWTRQVAQALEKMHSAGWVHCDVKPDNILIDSQGHATLVDLGFATQTHSPMHRVFRGTPDYASPELMSGKTAALPAMDVFALGRVLWESLSATAPVAQSTIEPVAELIEHMVAADPAQRPAVSEVVRRLLSLEIQTLGSHIVPSTSAKRIAA
ncbi:protein kinase family protein [Aporhodopirellula aestuarii]|uniref:Protein kinase family protein n=1 Tax=Aporhodopirellula aestuarii TaxID=2950107 RepID=A0ABT0U617_9BACT|nr:protein kinase family protein [Aporhodopirellula aestuarii]MCM2371980.1 protein kinase family protein [Aporhodopirellula aestuarii]